MRKGLRSSSLAYKSSRTSTELEEQTPHCLKIGDPALSTTRASAETDPRTETGHLAVVVTRECARSRSSFEIRYPAIALTRGFTENDPSNETRDSAETRSLFEIRFPDIATMESLTEIGDLEKQDNKSERSEQR